ncbi:hypothetical protein LIER_21273 [Lithospermum erythrorhizon]|uniref:CCHC-type domain-containing protein n=1 Tax=Lithospermum erythrorhizon TaxID=34254 RepID=A0AAV3QR62_LITER
MYEKTKIKFSSQGELDFLRMVNGFKNVGCQSDEWYNCGKRGHYAKNCWPKKFKGNIVTSFKNESPTEEDWDLETSFFVEEVDVVDVQGKDLVEEYALSTICEYSCDLKNDEIIDSGCSNHIIGEKVKVSVLPNTQELQEKLQMKLQLGPSQGGDNQTESKDPKLLINGKFQESDVQSKSRSIWRTNIHETPQTMQISSPEEDLPKQSQEQLRRSTRERMPSPKYLDVAFAEVKESTIFEEVLNSRE